MPIIYKAVGSNSNTEKEKHRSEKEVGEGKERRKKEKRLDCFLEIISHLGESKFLAKCCYP